MRAELARDFFPHFGVSADALKIERVDRQAGGLPFFVVTGDAVLGEDGRRCGTAFAEASAGKDGLGYLKVACAASLSAADDCTDIASTASIRQSVVASGLFISVYTTPGGFKGRN